MTNSLYHLLPPPRTTPPSPTQTGGAKFFDIDPVRPEHLKGSRLKHGGAEARYFDRSATMAAIDLVKQ